MSDSKRYMPGLDGLRAISVLAVIAYHFHFDWAPGGLLGVGVFFVISGYLITDQLLAEWKRNRSINLKQFWLRRARRLLPAMFAMLAVVALWLLVFDRSRLASLEDDFLSVTFYYNNWWLIFHQVSYFESFGPPSPIGHLWSLAVEEQFYLLWPILLIAGLTFFLRRGNIMLFALGGALLSAIAMAWLYEPGMDPSRVYYGTDTRVFALLIGAALAAVWPSGRLSETLSRRTRNVLDMLGAGCVLGILLMIALSHQYGSFLYYGGLVLLSLLSAIVIAVLAHPSSRLAKLIGCKPLRWIGVRSYSLYLWHFPVIIMTSPIVNTDGIDIDRVLLQFGASLLLAALSYKYIEEPLRRGWLGRVWNKMITSRQRRVAPSCVTEP